MRPDETARDLLGQLGHPNAQCIAARDGREHHLFRIWLPEGERLLKFPRRDALHDPYDPWRPPAERLRAEAWVVGERHGVAVPDPYTIYDTNPICAVMGVLPGTTAEIAYERGQLDHEMLVNVCLQMGRTLADIHRKKRPPEGGGVPDLVGMDPATARLLHLDYHLGNVLGRPKLGMGWQILGVVDWTCARWGPVEADLVEMQVSVFVTNPRAKDAFIAGYRQTSGRMIDVAEVERRASLEIQRRLEEDDAPTDELRRRWEDWASRRRG